MSPSHGPQSARAVVKRCPKGLARFAPVTGVYAGSVLSSEITLEGADRVVWSGRQNVVVRYREHCPDPPESETRCMHIRFLEGTREILELTVDYPVAGPAGGGLWPYDRHARLQEVGWDHSSDEAGEQ
jgi:hypothetical protein